MLIRVREGMLWQSLKSSRSCDACAGETKRRTLSDACVVRYMDKNREITRIKREEIRRLKEHLSLLQQRIERFLFTCLFSNAHNKEEESPHFLFDSPAASFQIRVLRIRSQKIAPC